MFEFDSKYTRHDERGVPIVKEAIYRKAMEMNANLVHVVFKENATPESSVLMIMPSLPNPGHQFRDSRDAIWIVETVYFKPSPIDLADGNVALYAQPTVIASRPAESPKFTP